MKRELFKELVKGAQLLVKEEAKARSSLLTSRENAAYFKRSVAPEKVQTTQIIFSAPKRAAPTQEPPAPQVAVVKRPVEAPPSAAPQPAAAALPVKAQATSVQPVRTAPQVPANEWKLALARHFPSMPTVDRPPDDARAIEISSRWKRHLLSASVLILYFGEKEEELLYLKNLAKAIHTQIKPTKILDALSLEKEKKWELTFQLNQLELIIADEASLFKLPELKRFYQAPTSVSLPMVSKVPLILLNPEVKLDKAALWKKICLILKTA
ncbi:MAG: hypothetical protein HYX48_07020 [Chlamydiales bacterium]|nr:hypothetical protein [Chlamydiales bacterium]